MHTWSPEPSLELRRDSGGLVSWRASGAAVHIPATRARPDELWWSQLSSITAPTLLIHGGPDSHVPGYRLEEMNRRIPDCRLSRFRSVIGYTCPPPDPFAELVLNFLASEAVPGVRR